MEFSWEYFCNDNEMVAVHCPTPENARKFCRLMSEHNLVWQTGRNYLGKNLWYDHKEKTCYTNQGSYLSLEDAYSNYNIYEFSEVMQVEENDI